MDSEKDEDVIDGVSASCLKKNKSEKDIRESEADGDIDEYHKRFNEELNITKTGKYDEFYSMDYLHKGYMIIFAHSTFKFKCLKDRNAEVDVIALQKLFSKLGFEIKVYRDYNLQDIQDVMEKVETMDFEQYACCTIAISSHGGDHIISARDSSYKHEVIFEPVKKNKTLMGKPKIFFISTCRGNRIDEGVSLYNTVQTDSDVLEEYTIPVEADCLYVYATVLGYFSYSNHEDGSQFFKYLTQTMEERSNEDLVSIITYANLMLSVNFTSYSKDPLYDNNKQCIHYNSTLIRKIRFK